MRGRRSRDEIAAQLERIFAVTSQSEPLPIVDFADDVQPPPLRWREVLAVIVLVVLCDATIYRGQGFGGYGLLFFAAPVLLFVGSLRRQYGVSLWVVGGMLALLSAKLLWCGSGLLVAAGFVLLIAFSMTLAGLCPFVLEMLVFASQTIPAGFKGIAEHGRSLSRTRVGRKTRGNWLNFTLPLMVGLAFGLVFILANPELAEAFGQRVEILVTAVRKWIIDFSPKPTEILFWLGVLWISVGLLRPLANRLLPEKTSGGDQTPQQDESQQPSQSPLFSAFRNTLATVIVLFAAYLAFEFKTLWLRVFEKGFYYSGYAHEGAAWLTLALAMATVVLSFIFRGRVLRDPRLSKLRLLAWVWSLENILLAVAVYHRLLIYIGFNGMSRMRMVGIFGSSAVLVGFMVVLWKIAHNRNFLWLVRRHLWTLALAVYLFALTPVDAIVVSYNVRRILSGDPAPAVQISVHPINPEGVLLLEPLLHCDDDTIREGVRAMLAARYDKALAKRRERKAWTSYQLVDEVLFRNLRSSSGVWSQYADLPARQATLDRFHEYAYQWY
jgi:hypothetical protein